MAFDVDDPFRVDYAAVIGNLAIEGVSCEDGVARGRCPLCGAMAFGAELPEDRGLLDALKREAPGILAWAVKGAEAYRKRGLKRPGRVREAVAEYRADSDVLGEFIATACVTGDEHRVAARALYRAYAAWARDAWDGQRLGPTAFGRRMCRRFRRTHKETGREYAGIGLRVSQARGSAGS